MRFIAPIIAAEGRRADQKQFARAKEILEAHVPPGDESEP
jgi:hypothetical protein